MEAKVLSGLTGVSFISDFIERWSIRFSPRFLSYQPHQDIQIETKNYTLKTAKSSEELLEVFRLRHMNFFGSHPESEEYDLDEFDHLCDHLIISSNETGEIVGTYRVLCSLYTDRFYSEGEFDMDQFLKEDGVKIELGRACIEVLHRNGHVIDLLWRGIGEYVRRTNGKFLFGCSSVKTIAPQMAYDLYQGFLKSGYCDETFQIKPRASYAMDYSNCLNGREINIKEAMPSLLRSYISAGAKVQGVPALDREFECVDFFTVLNMDEISPSYKRRYIS